MWKATIKGVLARKVRLALTALAIVLGVCFVTGTYVLTDTLKGSFDTVFAQFASGVDVAVSRKLPAGRDAQPARMPASVLRRITSAAGVGRASGVVNGDAQFVDAQGAPIQNGFSPTLGLSWNGPPQNVGPLTIVTGKPPAGPDEVAMDVGTAKAHGFAVGDPVRVLAQNRAAKPYRIAAIFGVGSAKSFAGISLAAFDTPTAQVLFGAGSTYDAFYVQAKSGTPPASAVRALKAELGSRYEVLSASELATTRGAPVRQGLSFLNDALLGFAGIGLFVGAFIIANTFTILIQQRTRELGLLRALGASGRQVLWSVIGEAVIVGLIAAVSGFVLGIGLAKALLAFLPTVGFSVPGGGLVIIGRTLVAAVVVGLVVTVASAVWPAVRAARIPPMAAINDTQPKVVGPLIRRTILGAVLVGLGVGLIVYGLTARGPFPGGLNLDRPEDGVKVVGLGAVTFFIGISVLGPLVARQLSRIVGRPLPSLFGVTGTLARNNAMRNPRRTNATSFALVIGLSLVCLVSIFAASAKSSVSRSLETGLRADFVLTAKSFSGFSTEVQPTAKALPEVNGAANLRFGSIRIRDKFQDQVTGTDPDSISKLINLDFTAGSAEGMKTGGILVDSNDARGYRLKVGDQLELEMAQGGKVSLPVVGIYKNRQFTGGVPVNFMISNARFTAGFGPNQQDTFLFVGARSGEAGAAKSALKSALKTPYPNVKVQTRAEFQQDQLRQIQTILNVFIALLLLSLVIATLGIVNTLLLSVYERTRELGLLRAVGMSRRQVRRMVRSESVIIAVIGCLVGIGMGLFWGWAFIAALSRQGISTFTVPYELLAGALVGAALVGMGAALIPAWRAGRLDILEAIAEE
jgi:putative ABC transport system permease protein